LAKIAADEALPVLARDLFAMHGREYVQLQAELKKIEARLMAWHRAKLPTAGVWRRFRGSGRSSPQRWS